MKRRMLIKAAIAAPVVVAAPLSFAESRPQIDYNAVLQTLTDGHMEMIIEHHQNLLLYGSSEIVIDGPDLVAITDKTGCWNE